LVIKRIPTKYLALVFSLLFCLVLFLGLDAIYSVIRRSRTPAAGNANDICFKLDPVQHHSLRENCSCIRRWGAESYPFATNSLGFRDQSVRQVPLVASRPRILLLGDSFTEGMSAWKDTYVGQLAAMFPKIAFLNGGVESYSPSNYLNVTRKLLREGVKFDEVIVFVDISDAQDEAAFYQDKSPTGAVDGPEPIIHNGGFYTGLRAFIKEHLFVTNSIVEYFGRIAVKHGIYRLNVGHGQLFDLERSAWTYRPVSDDKPYEIGYAPLGLEAGIRKEQSKMDQLWRELKDQGIPISVVVYPWPAQLAHDSVESRQVKIWRTWCEGKCRGFVSAFPAFFADKSACPREQPGCWYMEDFIFGDEHYSRAGNALVTDMVAAYLRSDPLVTQSLPQR